MATEKIKIGFHTKSIDNKVYETNVWLGSNYFINKNIILHKDQAEAKNYLVYIGDIDLKNTDTLYIYVYIADKTNPDYKSDPFKVEIPVKEYGIINTVFVDLDSQRMGELENEGIKRIIIGAGAPAPIKLKDIK